MKSIKNLDAYIYNQAILPLKKLEVENLNIQSPKIGGYKIKFSNTREFVNRSDYRHDYERNIAMRDRKYLIAMEVSKDGRRTQSPQVVASFNPTTKNVKIYTEPFKSFKVGKLIMNKLYKAFSGTTPFQKVEFEERCELDTQRQASPVIREAVDF